MTTTLKNTEVMNANYEITIVIDEKQVSIQDILKTMHALYGIKEVSLSEEKIGYWTRDDVRQQAKDNHLELTEDDVNAVFHYLDEHFDASRGMCWDDIDDAFDALGYAK